MKTLEGDLIQLALEGKFDVIVHGCNCFCEMGAGIAKAFRSHFPECYEADRKTVVGDRKKLGTLTSATIQREELEFVIVNGYTQFHYSQREGPFVPLVDYEALRSVMRRMKQQFSGKRIGYPKIGAGLAGGDWSQIAQIIQEELHEEDHTLVLLKSE
ncbi:MAG: macro domain-containing protein [Bdellovibrionales bacterium]|nr:macro domain-containing protein [Bdellovibrionales bacterium]